MPLDKAGLEADIKAILNNTKTQEGNQQVVVDTYAAQLAAAIDKFVKSGLVVTSGSPTTHTGQVT
jgi:hypothetical protein